jgi:ferric-dicitrate binding protein FerR (iron transport regulator)
MEKIFQSVEEVLTDELFQAWYFKTDAQKASAWEQWLKQHPSHQQLSNEAAACMQAIIIREHEIPATQVEASGQRLMNNLPGANVIQMAPARRRNWWWSAAAAILLVIAGTYLWTNLNGQSSIKTAYGQVTQKQLPDGSEVVLNANSSISYSSGWEEGKEREVWIKGEAFFHVKKTANKSRFVVHTNEMDIIVTGTQFNVVSRSDKSSVMLTEGSVFIRTKEGKETKLLPGDFVELMNSQLEKKAVKEESVLAWKEKKIVFDNTPLTEVVKQIKEHYGEDVIIADDSLANKTITGMMPNDNLEVLLKSLEAILECTVVRKDGRIIIANP